MSYGAISIGNTATLILPANNARKGCLIGNNSGSVVLYVGPDSAVTSSTGMPVATGATFQNSDLDAAWRGDIYGIVASSTADIRYWEWM